jgi:hypothetical protein
MKLLRRNGRELLVYDLAEPVYRLDAVLGPIKLQGCFILDDAAAGGWVRRLVAAQNNPTLWSTP